MGTMTFRLPAGISADARQALERACLVGGPDNMPWATAFEVDSSLLRLTRASDESGFLVAPWSVAGFGRLAVMSATLMERDEPYSLLVELARGKVNQLRCQASDWQAGGLEMAAGLAGRIREASRAFGRALTCGDPAEADRLAQHALDLAAEASAELVRLYAAQVFRIRHQRHDRFDTALACRLDESACDAATGQAVALAFNRAIVPLSWHVVERTEHAYDWRAADRMLDWAEENRLEPGAGPLIDFSSAQLPAWLWAWDRDVPSMAAFMCRFVEAAVRRYRSRIRRWQVTAASNSASLLGLTDEELMGLTYRLGEAARSVDPSLELVVGIAQPWGEYLVPAERPSPFWFADHLIRSGLQVGGLDLEVCMGCSGRGSYCRDPLDLSRLLDLYALLGVPLSVTLAYPSSPRPDPNADPELTPGAGCWRSGYDPEAQREWAEAFASLALCKTYVHSVCWANLSDAQPHLLPNAGLFDRAGAARPALEALRRLRAEHQR